MAPYKYQRRSPEDWAKRRNQQGGDFEGVFLDEFQTYTEKKGRNNIRILPPFWHDCHHFGYDIYIHRNVGKGTVLCLREHKNKKCPMCEAAAAAEREGDKDLAKSLRAQHRVVVWLLDRGDEDKGPLLWSMPWRFDREISKVAQDPDTGEVFELDHPKAGFDIYFDREGDGIQTKRSSPILARKPSSVADKWIEFVKTNPLPDTLHWRTYNEIAALYAGGEEEPEERGRQEEAAAPVKRRARTVEDEDEAPVRRRAVVEPEDEDEPAPVKRRAAVVEDDDEPAPVKRRRVVEPEDDDEPAPVKRRAAVVEDDEDEPAPVKRRRVVEPVDDEDEPAPVKRRTAVVEEDDDEPAPVKRRRVVEPEDDDEPAPVKRAALRKPANGDDDEIPWERIDKKKNGDDAPKRKARVEEDEEEEVIPPKRAAALRESFKNRRA